jgi:hypothetical protein
MNLTYSKGSLPLKTSFRVAISTCIRLIVENLMAKKQAFT